MHLIKQIIKQMKNNSLDNYILPSLQSSMIGGGDFGCVRLFENERAQLGSVTPHSHRFDFTCLVLEGSVENQQWFETDEKQGDFFELSSITYGGEPGKYERRKEGRNFYKYTPSQYCKGETYSMVADDIHSIKFSKGAKVLFSEGAKKSDISLILEPVVNGRKIETRASLPWMYEPVAEQL